jgi:hypothetical protein
VLAVCYSSPLVGMDQPVERVGKEILLSVDG